MPTSATGIWTARQSLAQSGFTLLEIMVVLVLIGILSTFAVLSAPDRGLDQRLEEETQRLGALLELGREEAILRGEQRGARFHDRGYMFLTQTRDGTWIAAEGRLLRPRTLPEDMTLALSVEGQPVNLTDIAADSPPQVLLLSSGETTEFTLTLSGDGFGVDRAAWRLTGDVLGGLDLAPAP